MKPIKTKAQIRAEIENQVNDYLDDGGAVEEVARGVSGRDAQANPFTKTTFFGEEQQTRTPVDDIVKAIDERKKHKTSPPTPSTKRQSRPKKKLIYDEFGEPLRWVWEDS